MFTRVCVICKRSINFGVPRVIWGEGLAHVHCRKEAREKNIKEPKPLVND
jgi:hypothetical protein